VGSIALPAAVDPAGLTWSVEGPLQAYDVAAGSLTVMGTTFLLTTGQLIDTGGLASPLSITLATLASPAPGFPLPTGGVVKAGGAVVVTTPGCGAMVPDAIIFEFAENVMVGPLVSVDVAAGTFNVAGTTVTMNADPRIPSELLDLNFDPMTVAELVGWEGSLITAEGYFRNGLLYAKLAETEVLPARGTDAVALTRADWRQSKGSVDVRGTVFPLPGVPVAATIAVDVGCNGTVDNNAATVAGAVLGTFDFNYRSANNAFRANPGTVCVTSPQGGTASATFVVR